MTLHKQTFYIRFCYFNEYFYNLCVKNGIFQPALFESLVFFMNHIHNHWILTQNNQNKKIFKNSDLYPPKPSPDIYFCLLLHYDLPFANFDQKTKELLVKIFKSNVYPFGAIVELENNVFTFGESANENLTFKRNVIKEAKFLISDPMLPYFCSQQMWVTQQILKRENRNF